MLDLFRLYPVASKIPKNNILQRLEISFLFSLLGLLKVINTGETILIPQIML